MVRDGQAADVHPDEVESWKGHGWREADDVPKAAGDPPSSTATARELREWLEASNADIPAGAKKADLVALVEQISGQ
jgi:hypothetical protein